MNENEQILLNELIKKCGAIHTDMNKDSLPKLYHYTNYEGLKKIIDTKKLRYTDYRYFNDPSEILFGKKLLIATLINAEITGPFLAATIEYLDSFDSLYSIYVSCFSKDIEKLSLWRYYASNGTGFAIEFNKSFLRIENPLEPSYGKGVFGHVIYGIDEGREIIKPFISAYEDTLKKVNGYSKDFKKHLDAHFASNLISLLPFLKDESYKDENEARIFYIEGPGLLVSQTKAFYFNDLFRTLIPISNCPYPFVNSKSGYKSALLPEGFVPSDINTIWVGPCCEFIAARTAIRKLLTDNDYDVDSVEIRQIELPYQHS